MYGKKNIQIPDNNIIMDINSNFQSKKFQNNNFEDASNPFASLNFAAEVELPTETIPEPVSVPPSDNTSDIIRLNDLDGNIMQDRAYNKIDNKILKLELQINFVENNLTKINSEIQLAKEFKNSNALTELNKRKEKLMRELNRLNENYKSLNVETNITTKFTDAISFGTKLTKFFNKIKENFILKFLIKISKTFDKKYNLKKALETLSNINNSVDDLISMQTPYGETFVRYEKLTTYLNHANYIHANISRNLKSN